MEIKLQFLVKSFGYDCTYFKIRAMLNCFGTFLDRYILNKMKENTVKINKRQRHKNLSPIKFVLQLGKYSRYQQLSGRRLCVIVCAFWDQGPG